MKKLVGTEEAARIPIEEGWNTPKDQWESEGISERTFFRKLRKDKYEIKYELSLKRGGKSGQHLLVRPKDEILKQPVKQVQGMVQDDLPTLGELRQAGKKRYKMKRGEPGANIVTSLKNGVPILDDSTSNPVIFPESSTGGGTIFIPEQIPTPVYPPSTTANLPATLGSGLRRNGKAERIAYLKFAILQKLNEELTNLYPETLPLFKNGNSKPSRTKSIQKFLDLYNSGILLPEIHGELGSISRTTLYSWLKLYEQGGIDSLIPQYIGPKTSDITLAEKQFLRTKLLDQNKSTIGDTINKCKFLLGESSPSNPSKLRRWINDFRKNNYDVWVLEREGEKALNDKCVPYAEREWRDLAVGEGVVGDGTKLNFQVINPFTGKPTRAVMVLFWDWKSAYPLGWEIMLTESIQCVAAALRNSIITLGKFPKHAFIDNGKAFRSNVFNKKFRFQDTEIPGIFDKLGIIPHFALPYNAQSKPIERFFRTFNDWFEREMKSYTGSSISDKPAYMNRNEKRAKALHDGDGWVPTIQETMGLIFRWREYYADQKLKSRDYQRPRDLFEAEKGPGVDPFALHFLMMGCKARMVHRNGITFNGWHWYHENLYGFKDYVLMFYSFYDLSQVYIFTMQNGFPKEFLCVAKPVEKVNPFAADSEFPEDMAAVNQINATKRKSVNATKKLVDSLQSQKNLNIDWNRKFRDRPEVAEAIKQIENKKKPIVNLSPFAGAPEPEMPVEEKYPYPFYPDTEWARYEFHLKGGEYRGPELDRQFIDDFRSGKIAPGLWEALYGEKERLESEEVNHERKVCYH